MPEHRDLRPMDIRDILDESIELWRENFGLFATIAVIVLLPVSLATSAIQGAALGAPGGLSPAGLVPFALASVISLLFTWVVQAALTTAISDRYLGRSITPAEAYGRNLRRLAPLFATIFFSMIAAMVGVLLCCVGILPVMFMISLAVPAFVVEGVSGIPALRRSLELFRFDWGKVVGTELLAGLAFGAIVWAFTVGATLITNIAGMSASPVARQVVVGASNGVLEALFMPIYLAVIVLLYYDLRIRREGFDLEVLARELGDEQP